ncbi:transcriptional regulator ATRX homolog isoform X2 [Oncorhynchus clarkii lewisi]|uniref:transcriptional regulator ATRX homolog isoform X2 n=1 Tax=Oncorhynchus clarkii lewisi TaxID=490388 RepID=UPI0039B8E99B
MFSEAPLMSNQGRDGEEFEELARPEPPPQKPVHRPEMYTQERRRTLQERTMPSQQEPPARQQVPKMMPREPSLPARSMSLRKAMSLQNLSQIETPWEGVTLNRCLFIAITILLVSTVFQKLHETIKGGRGVEEEEYDIALTVRRSALRHKVQPQEPETSLYEVLFWWLPDIDDDNEEEADEGETKQGRVKKRVRERSLKGLRGNGTPERKLVKGREGKTKDKRAKRERDEETKGKKKGKQAKLRDVENMDEEEEINEGEDEVKPKKLQKVMKSKASKS